MSLSMRRALEIKITVKETFNVKEAAQNVRTERNTVPDLLSRGSPKRAREHMEGKLRWVEDDDIRTGWENFRSPRYEGGASSSLD